MIISIRLFGRRRLHGFDLASFFSRKYPMNPSYYRTVIISSQNGRSNQLWNIGIEFEQFYRMKYGIISDLSDTRFKYAGSSGIESTQMFMTECNQSRQYITRLRYPRIDPPYSIQLKSL